MTRRLTNLLIDLDPTAIKAAVGVGLILVGTARVMICVIWMFS